jgi:hypothetical protein
MSYAYSLMLSSDETMLIAGTRTRGIIVMDITDKYNIQYIQTLDNTGSVYGLG